MQTQNLFLASLSPQSREALTAHCTAVDLPLGTPLYKPQETPHFAYFITSGMASLVVATIDGDSAEVGIIGREGIVGGMHLLGPGLIPTKCMIQLAATALRISFPTLQVAFDSSSEIRRRILEMAQEQALSSSQIAGCHRLHHAEERLCRWLLMAHDRTQLDVLEFTHEYLAEMLGARRTTVTLIAGALQRAGLIEYKRGKVRIIDRQELELAACDCYGVVNELFKNLYQKPVQDALHVVSKHG